MQTVSLEGLDDFAAGLVGSLPRSEAAAVLALSGNLGAGKTSLTQAIGRVLGIGNKIPSPTFLVMRSYAALHPRFKKLVHIDAYRIDDPRELEMLNFRDLLKEKDTLISIEWPERIESLLPSHAVRVSLESVGEKERMVRVVAGK